MCWVVQLRILGQVAYEAYADQTFCGWGVLDKCEQELWEKVARTVIKVRDWRVDKAVAILLSQEDTYYL